MKTKAGRKEEKTKAKKEKGKIKDKKREATEGWEEERKKDGTTVLSPIHSFAGYSVSLFCRRNTSECSNSFT